MIPHALGFDFESRPAAGLLPASAWPLMAQPKPPETGPAKFAMAKEYRAVQQSALKAQRKLLVSFADSMPERLYRDRATPAQRSFSEQVHHIVSANLFIANMFLTGRPYTDADTTGVLNSRADLKKCVTERYDVLDQMLTEQTDADRDVQVKFFGTMIPRWQVWDELNQHTTWTAGQTVANFRNNGMAPPSFLFF